ncbi:MAG: hypothetical protein WC624_00045 [Candidatus Margulisiibacteriota bacterium]
MKRFAVICFLLFMAASGYAQDKDLTINAASMFYDRDKSSIEATGSVEVVFKNVKITGEHLIYKIASREAYLDSGFTFAFNGLNFSGKKLKYDFNKETGSAKMVKIQYEKANISGNDVEFGTEEVKLKNAAFEACGLDSPHYHLSAAEIDLFQKQGWLASYWGIFWLGSVPSIPIPVYVYDFKAEQKGKKNVMPYPEIGNNTDDGFWISETMSWHLKPELNGNYSFNYTANRGIGGGFKLNYLIDEDRETDADIYLSGSEGPRWGIGYLNSFGEEIKQEQEPSILSISSYKKYEFSARLSSRERINYERVSQLPDLIVRLRNIPFMKGGIEGSVSAGQIAEESSSTSLNRENVYLKTKQTLFDGISVGGISDSSLYGNGTHWVKLIGSLGYERKLSPSLDSLINYSHYFANRGQSPFNYEKYRFDARDTIGLSLKSNSENGKFIFSCSYFLPDLSPQDIDYTAGVKIHCFSVDLTYRAMRQEVTFGFSLN